MNLNEKFDDIDRKIYSLSRPLYVSNNKAAAVSGGAVELFKIKAVAAVRWGIVRALVSVPQACGIEIVFYDSGGNVCYRSGTFNLVQGTNSIITPFYYKGNDAVSVKLEASGTFNLELGDAVAIINGAA